AKRLRSVLNQYAGKAGPGVRAPFVAAAVYLHARNMHAELDPVGRQHIYGPRNSPGSGLPDIASLPLAAPADTRIDRTRAREIVRPLEAAGVRPAPADRTVGQLLLAPRPYAEGRGWQDYLAGHQVQTQVVRRVRFYLTARAEPAERDMIARAAEREFRI